MSENERPDQQPVITAKTKVRKKGFLSKIADSFFYESIPDLLIDIGKKYILPHIRDYAADLVDDARDHIRSKIYKDDERVVRHRGNRRQKDYHNRYKGSGHSERRKRMTDRVNNDPNSIEFETRSDAQDVLDRLNYIIREMDYVKVSEFFGLIDEKCDYTCERYGWYSLKGVSIVPVGNRGNVGWVIQFPMPEYLDL